MEEQLQRQLARALMASNARVAAAADTARALAASSSKRAAGNGGDPQVGTIVLEEASPAYAMAVTADCMFNRQT
jgi:hypothetical protein